MNTGLRDNGKVRVHGFRVSPFGRSRNDGLARSFAAFGLPEGLAQAGQHLLGVKFEEARLVGAGGVKDEVTEAELDIKADALDLLVGVARDNPAARGAIERQSVGEALHLDRILDAG